MQFEQEILRAGQGTWGGIPVEFAVSVARTTWHSLLSSETIIKTDYRFSAVRTADRNLLAVHYFPSREAAEQDANYSIPDASPLDVRAIELPGERPSLDAWVGETLEGVCFVFDYVQLRLSSMDVLDFAAWPIVTIDGRDIRVSEPGYRDALCALLGQQLVAADDFVDVGIVADLTSASFRIEPSDLKNAGPFVIAIGAEYLVEPNAPPWSVFM